MGDNKCIGGAVFRLDDNGVYCSPERKFFDYSDGKDIELYLEKVFTECRDLSSESYELEARSKDWATEYHLTRKRAQLLSAFAFGKKSRVLEVGCGCGAISRILGEKFDEVVAVEGSYNRAKLAKMRCKDLENVSVVCSRYQDLAFDSEFDFVFCIGVLEYAGYLVGGDDPYSAAINSFEKALRPGGVLVIAIENQYGLKYFAKATEDHTNRMFEGVEGYPIYRDMVKTFGHEDIRNRLSRFFSNVEFFYPYPDYKIPDCVLSEKFVKEAKPAELIGGIRSRDYGRTSPVLFSEMLAYHDLAENNQLPFFSNSFLIFCGDGDLPRLNGKEGVLFSSGRLPEFSTVTSFRRSVTEENNGFYVSKERRYSAIPVSYGSAVAFKACESQWHGGKSLHGRMIDELLKKNIGWEKLGELVVLWLEALRHEARLENSTMKLPGGFLDATWKNCFICDGSARFVDLEWTVPVALNIELIFLRSYAILIDDLVRVEAGRKVLIRNSSLTILKKISDLAGLCIDNRALKEYVMFEYEVQALLTGKEGNYLKILLFLSLSSPYFLWLMRRTGDHSIAILNIPKRAIRVFRRILN